MTREEYIIWKATRGDDAAKWDYKVCKEADDLIKREALRNLAGIIFKEVKLPALIDFIMVMASYKYGSIETNEMLTKLKAYPDWM